MSAFVAIYKPLNLSKYDENNENHDILYFNVKMNHRYHRNCMKINDKFPCYKKSFEVSGIYSETIWIEDIKYLPIECIFYCQGWFLNKQFFNNKSTIYYAIKKNHVIRLMNQFFDFTRCGDIYSKCLDTFENGMIFEISF